MGKKTDDKTTALALAEAFPILVKEPAEIKAIMDANLAGGQMTAFDFDRVTIPPAGGRMWNVPTLDGGEASETEVIGIIGHWQDVRAYWPGEFAGGEPPSCSSEDARLGVGDPGGNCQACGLAAFGSDKDARGQACKQMRRLYIIRPGQLLPLVLTLPPSSLRAVRQFFVRLTSAQMPYWAVIAGVGLEAAANKQGIKYSKATFRVVRVLTDDEATRITAYVGSLREAFGSLEVSTADYGLPEDGPDEGDGPSGFDT